MAYDPAKLLELEQSKVQQAQENQILKQQVAELAKDKSLQEKNKSITKKHKDKISYLVFFVLKWSNPSLSIEL